MTEVASENYKAIKKVDPVSLGKYLMGIYLLILGFVGIIMLIAGLITLVMGEWEIFLVGVGMFVAMAVFYAGMGFVAGVVGGFLYNVIASKMGGIRIVLE